MPYGILSADAADDDRLSLQAGVPPPGAVASLLLDDGLPPRTGPHQDFHLDRWPRSTPLRCLWARAFPQRDTQGNPLSCLRVAPAYLRRKGNYPTFIREHKGQEAPPLSTGRQPFQGR